MDGAQGQMRCGRILLYSHDTFGLGHLRRSRTIAQALTATDPNAAALIVTGSPVAGRYDFPDRVDHVRLPGVVKLPDGDYASHNLGLDIEQTVSIRAAILKATTEAFAPDLVIIDKEPLGFRNELIDTLMTARTQGARIVLGLRDVLDEPGALKDEWTRKGAIEAVERRYDEIWVYGLPEICKPLAGLSLSSALANRLHYTGYLRREAPDWPVQLISPEKPYALITTGGGGDGAQLVDWALSAYETDPDIPLRGVIVYGPFLNAERRAEFERRAQLLGGRVETVGFEARLERMMDEAVGVVAMGGYNTFCEILSFDKPAVIAPRTAPRLEQYVRTEAAERLGLVRMLHRPRDGGGPEVMAAAIRGLITQPRPSNIAIPGLLDGLDTIVARAAIAPAPGRIAGG